MCGKIEGTSVRHSFTYPSPPPFVGSMRILITTDLLSGIVGGRQGTPEDNDPSFGRNAFNSERPWNVKPTDQGGVAIDGRGDLPEGHANMADKVIGKVQKVWLLLVSVAYSVLIFVCSLVGHWEVYE